MFKLGVYRLDQFQKPSSIQAWLSRNRVSFHLLRGPVRDDHVLYASHTLWRDKADFEAWTRSEAFRLAHRDAGQNRPLYLGHPEFEGFEVIQEIAV